MQATAQLLNYIVADMPLCCLYRNMPIYTYMYFADAPYSMSGSEVLRIGIAAARQLGQPLCRLLEASPFCLDVLARVQSLVLAFASSSMADESLPQYATSGLLMTS